MDMKSKNTDITSGLENIGAAIEDCMRISGIDTLKTNLKQANKNIPICIDEITAACDRKTVSIDRDISHYEYLQRQDNITWY
ncbi:MAG: hypothetical protein LBG97_00665 [Coriobacteriales bacterium]|nr:hypothetical protein [Coriobacteriales bacterium]